MGKAKSSSFLPRSRDSAFHSATFRGNRTTQPPGSSSSTITATVESSVIAWPRSAIAYRNTIPSNTDELSQGKTQPTECLTQAPFPPTLVNPNDSANPTRPREKQTRQRKLDTDNSWSTLTQELKQKNSLPSESSSLAPAPRP